MTKVDKLDEISPSSPYDEVENQMENMFNSDAISAPDHEDMEEDPPNSSAQNEVINYEYTCDPCGSKFESLSEYNDHMSNCPLWQAEQNSEQNTSVQNDDGDKEYYCHFCIKWIYFKKYAFGCTFIMKNQHLHTEFFSDGNST